MSNSIELEVELAKVERMPVRTTWQVIQTGFNVLNHIVILFVAVYMTCLTYNAGNTPISWHAFLCTIGYQLLMAQAILAFYSQNLWSKQYPRQKQRTLHWILQVVGSSAALIGMCIEFIGRSQHGKSHFKSIHSLFGLTAGILTLISMLGGISALWSFELKKYARPIYFKCAHSLNGITAFLLGMVSLYLGYDKNFMIKNACEDIRLWLQAFAVITIILTLIGALRSVKRSIRIVFAK